MPLRPSPRQRCHGAGGSRSRCALVSFIASEHARVVMPFLRSGTLHALSASAPMASFKRFSNLFFGFSLLAASAFISEACSVQLSADLAGDMTGAKEGDDFSNSVGATSGGGGKGVVLPTPDTGGAGASSFSDMCGVGCMSDDPALACPPSPNPENPPSTSCQVVPTDMGAVAECLPPGVFQDGEPCEKAANCAASLGCVRMGSDVSVCRPYCCGNIEDCAPGTYCTIGAMAEDVSPAKPLPIPVCIPATPCTLLDDTTCPAGRTCTLVRADGTTSCVEPGPGKDGDACPCTAGHVCVLSSRTCRALCHVGGSDCPNGMLCQGGSEGFPDGIGVCVK